MEAQRFWNIYSKKLQNYADNNPQEIYKAYQGIGSWTHKIMPMAKSAIEEFLNSNNVENTLDVHVDSEYFRIDLIGYIKNKKSDWELKVAYEHENSDTWGSEFCKLCHIVADLRVIASYYDNDSKIKCVLEKKVHDLGLWRIHRVPNSSWLFIFGPRCKCQDKPFKAFTIDSQLNVIELENDKKIIPAEWNRVSNK